MRFISSWHVALILSPALVWACASDDTTTRVAWDCQDVHVPLGRTIECTSSVKNALAVDDGPVTDGPAYVCPVGIVDSDCPPPAGSTKPTIATKTETPAGDDGPASDGFYCTKESGKRTCRKTPTCDPGAHRQQMDCEPDQSSGLGVGGVGGGVGTAQRGGYPGAGGGDPSMPGGEMQCFYPVGAPPATTMPAATFEYVLEAIAGASQLHMRLTFSPHFVDNSYGATSIGWAKQHQFRELVGSDHAELSFFDKASTEKLHFKMDYLSQSAKAPSGWACLGVTGGEGRMILGNASAITKAISSLDRNLNERGYAQYVVDSPKSDDNYAPPPAAPSWDYRVVYEAWIQNDAFGPNGFGNVKLAFVHASPSKANSNTLPVEPGPCPSGWGTSSASSASASAPSGSPGTTPEACEGSSDNPELCPSDAPIVK
jgi:hypothetical protein